MQKHAIRCERRATRRILRSELRRRTAATRLTASCHRRPRSLATVAIAAGVTKDIVPGVTNGLRAAAKRCELAPAVTARTKRTVTRGHGRRSHSVSRWTLGQVCTLTAAYRPRKAEYVAAVALIAAFATNAA